MRCRDVREELVAYIDEELSPMGMRAIEAHLAQCHECTAEYKRMKQTIEWTRQVEKIEPQAGWWEKLQEQIRVEESKLDLIAEVRALHESIARIEARIDKQAASVKEVMTLAEVAAYLQVNADTVWDLLNEIPHFQVAYELRFKKSSVDEWIRMKENGTHGDLFPWALPISWQRRLERFER